MSPAHASPLPLRKVTINLYEEDVQRAETLFGYGWSEQLREIIHEALKAKTKLTIEDIMKDRLND